jgi:hypothetical protein
MHQSAADTHVAQPGSREQEPWFAVGASPLANGRVSVLIRRVLMGSAAAVAMAGCASGSHVSSLSQPSADPTVYAATGSPSGPVFPEPSEHHDHDLVTAASGHVRRGLSVRCRRDRERLVRDGLLSMRAHRIARQRDLFNCPSGWSPLVIDPAGAAKSAH